MRCKIHSEYREMSRDGTGKLVLAEALADVVATQQTYLTTWGLEATCGGLTVKAASSQTQEQIDATQRLLVVNCWIPTVKRSRRSFESAAS